MSIKLYNLYRMKCDSLMESRLFLESFREQAKLLAKKLVAITLAETTILTIDRRACGFDQEYVCGVNNQTFTVDETKSPIANYRNLFQDKFLESCVPYASRSWPFDVQCSLTCIPHTDGRLYIMISSTYREYEKLLESFPGVEEFRYWNNSDHPDEISDAEWEYRRDTLDMIMPSGIPSNHGWTTDVVRDIDIARCDVDEAIKYCPSFKARVSDTAKSIMQDESCGDGLFVYKGNYILGELTETGQQFFEQLKSAVRNRIVAQPDRLDFLKWKQKGLSVVAEVRGPRTARLNTPIQTEGE